MTLEDDGVRRTWRVRRGRYADKSGPVVAGAFAAAFAIAAAAPGAKAAPAQAGGESPVAASAAPLPLRTAEYRTPDGDIDTLPRLGNICIKDESGNDVVVMGRMSDTTIYTRLFATFSDRAPVTVRYDVSQDGADYRTVLDRDYRTEESRADDYVISLAVDAMKVYSDVCNR